ncbi:hypothetical protein FK535_16765 [Mycolicibacterium sp. 018/SC-01/001]|uniref:hypothetical protein n=1 Tax=Mycolicibacterium sp. 018/SC-01/001 TaxID=2592069 RepID=UPI00117D2435|nr:hypothetical protein [Mycolicibacterium sp. 018/SC-01/001]TRW81534.1 hypothetical protein FK535_16765 [Mycolicibacterium sp. 018/SC-01/001]
MTMSRTLAVVAAAGAIAGALTAGTGAAQAQPFTPQARSWCPGQALPEPGMRWDMNVCHTWYIVPFGKGNVTMVALNGEHLDSWIYADGPAPVLTPPPPPPSGPPPGTPFCSPRGALIIIPPICDEIGVDWPPGSLKH